MNYYFISSRLDQKLNKSSNKLLRVLLNRKLCTNGKLNNPREAGDYIIEKYALCSGPHFIWKKIKFDNYEILVLRDALFFCEYMTKCSAGYDYWDKMLKFSPEEESELQEYSQSIVDSENSKEDSH